MKKKKSGGGGANWMDTYGDMVTLLLCFFVLLYSMSTVDTDKWKALVQSFNPKAIQTATDPNGTGGPIADPDAGIDHPGMDKPEDLQAAVDEAIEMLFQAIEGYSEENGMQQSINVTKDGGKIYVSFRDTAFFDGDSSVLRRDAYPILDAVSAMLAEHAWAIDTVHVSGHTAQAGNTPNRTRTDRMLASNRATEVVIYIQEHTDNDVLNPGKLIDQGCGQWHPVATNDTPEGMAANRRVEFEISGRDLETELGDNVESYETNTYTTKPADGGDG